MYYECGGMLGVEAQDRMSPYLIGMFNQKLPLCVDLHQLLVSPIDDCLYPLYGLAERIHIDKIHSCGLESLRLDAIMSGESS